MDITPAMKKVTHDWTKMMTIIALLMLAVSVGSIVQDSLSQKPAELEQIGEETRVAKVPTIVLEKTENGILFANITGGDARIIVSDNEEVVTGQGSVEVDITPVLPTLKMIPHPEGMQYVASKRGKYYWPLDGIEAHQIAWANRTFFASSEDAEIAGYIYGK